MTTTETTRTAPTTNGDQYTHVAYSARRDPTEASAAPAVPALAVLTPAR